MNDAIRWHNSFCDAKSGSQNAIGEFCEQYREYLQTLAEQQVSGDLRRKVACSDIAQETLINASRGFHDFAGRTEVHFKRWLFVLLSNNVNDALRKYRYSKRREFGKEVCVNDLSSPLFPVDDETASKLMMKGEADVELMRAVSQLTEKEQQVIELRHRDGMSFRDVALCLAMTEVAARKLWSRTIMRLKELVND